MNYSIPIAVGFMAVAAFMIWHEKNRQKRISQEYDEMQLRIRGKGAWYSFYAMILFMAVYMLLEKASGFAMLTAADALFLGAVLCGSVNVGYSILHDSYYGLDHTGGQNLLFLGIVAVMEVLGIFMLVRLLSEGIVKGWSETIRDERILIVLCLPLFTTILVTTLIRRLHPEEEDD